MSLAPLQSQVGVTPWAPRRRLGRGSRVVREPKTHLWGSRRPRRVLLLLLALWVLNGFDLALTLLATGRDGFVELNPLAARLLHSAAGLIAFKLAMVGLASAIIVLLRRRRTTELGCWGMCAAYTGLACMWSVFYRIT